MSLINEENKRLSLPNLAIIIGLVGGLLLMFGGLYKEIPEVYIPASAVACAALGGAGVKAHKRTS
jgi:hypothetical protein